MFKINTVKNCPYTRKSHGTIRMPHTLIAELAGAVEDDDLEWLALFVGTRAPNGLSITVTGLEVPKQYRNAGVCGLEEEVSSDPRIVGVVHSHHTFGAFFSKTDETTFNTRFPVSLVIARTKGQSYVGHCFGFEYLAEGRILLPCGDVGIVPFYLVPTPVPKHWIYPVTTELRPDTYGFGDCPNFVGDARTDVAKASCGEARHLLPAKVFGKTGQTLMADVVANTRYVSPVQETWIDCGLPPLKNWLKKPDWATSNQRPAGISKKQWRKMRRLELTPHGGTKLVTVESKPNGTNGNGDRVKWLQCRLCFLQKIDVGIGTSWGSFVAHYTDGTGVCRECSMKQPKEQLVQLGIQPEEIDDEKK